MSSSVEYASQKYLLIYYLHDKSIAIVHIDDVISWTPEEFEKLKICRRIELKVNNDDMKVLVLQCAANYDALKETSKFVVEMKRKKQTISFIQTHFNPVRGLNRERLPPVYMPHSKDKSFSLKPLPPLKTPTFPVTLKSLSENKISMSQSPLPNLDCIRTSLNLSDVPSFQLPVSTIQPFLSPHHSSDLSLLHMHDSMLGVCSRLKVEPFSSQGQFLMSAYILCELNTIQSKLTNFEQRQGRLEAHVAGDPIDQNVCHTQFPIFTSLQQYSEIEKHPKNMLTWMKREGGLTVYEHISRVLNKLLAHNLQQKINRPGTNGKQKFFDSLENQLKTSTLNLFPGTSSKEIELKVARFFNNARDRSGGCLRRCKKKTLEVSIEEESKDDDYEGNDDDSENEDGSENEDPRQKKLKT